MLDDGSYMPNEFSVADGIFDHERREFVTFFEFPAPMMGFDYAVGMLRFSEDYSTIEYGESSLGTYGVEDEYLVSFEGWQRNLNRQPVDCATLRPQLDWDFLEMVNPDYY